MADNQAVIRITGDPSGLVAAVAKANASMRDLQGEVRRSSDGVRDAFGRAFGLLAGGIAVGAIAGRFRAIVDGLDALNDAADQTGTSVEKLSALEGALAPYGHTLQTITDMTGKLVRSMGESTDATSKAAQAFRILGVEAIDKVTGRLKDPIDTLREVAQALNRFEDGSNKVALAQAILGKTAGEQLDKLKDLGNLSADNARITREQAEAAERFNQELRKMQYESAQAGRSFVANLLPPLTELLRKFNQARGAGLGLWDSLDTIPGANANSQTLIRQRQARIDQLRGEQAAIRDAQARRARGEYVMGGGGTAESRDPEIQRLERSIEVIKAQARDAALAAGGDGALDARDLRLRGGAALPSLPTLKDPEELKRAAEEERQRNKRLREEEIRDLVKGVEEQMKEEEGLVTYWAENSEFRVTMTKQEWEQRLRIAQENSARLREIETADLNRFMGAYEDIRMQPAELNRLSAEFAEQNERDFDRWLAQFKDSSRAIEDQTSLWKDLGFTAKSELEAIIIEGERGRGVLNALVADLSRAVLRKYALEPGSDAFIRGLQLAGNYLIGSYQGMGSPNEGIDAAGAVGYPGRAVGGYVEAGRMYRVNEMGGEYFQPGVSGKVIPAGEGGGAVVVQQNISVGVAQTVRAEMLRLLPKFQRAFESGWAARRAQGGPYALT